jgi:hypothetical protein
LDVAQRRILGTFCVLRPFRRGELSLEAIQQAVEHKTLAFVQWEICKTLTTARLRQDGCESLRAFDGAAYSS